MGTDSETSSNAATDAPKRARRPATGIRALIVLIACCAAILWAGRYLSNFFDPVRNEARVIQRQAIAALQSGGPAERQAAIVQLQRLHYADDAFAIPPLTRALEDPEPQVRAASAEALASLAAGVAKTHSGEGVLRDAATILIRCLNDPEPTVRDASALALGSVVSGILHSGSGGETARDAATALIQCLKDPEPRVRRAATSSLGFLSWPRTAAAANSPIEREAVLSKLIAMFHDRDAGVRLAAIQVVASHPPGGSPSEGLAEALKDESAENRLAAIQGLSSVRRGLDPWIPILIRLAEHDPEPSVRQQCLNRLEFGFQPPAITAAAVPALIAGLKSGDAKIRCQVASLLGRLKANAVAAVPELLRVLNEPLAGDVRPFFGANNTFDPGCAAASALGQIAPRSVEAKRAVAALTEVIRSGPVSRRGWAAMALGEFGPSAEEAVPVLIEVLEQGPHETPTQNEACVAVALGKIAADTPSADRAIAALLPLLESRVHSSRLSAIQAVGRFGTRAAAGLPKLHALEGDRDKAVSAAASRSLDAIQAPGVP